MPPRLRFGAFRCSAAALTLATAGCVSAQTARALDGSYAAVEGPIRDSKRRSARELAPSGGGDSTAIETPLERDLVVARALARSPALASLAHRARALVYAGRAEGSLPSAELGFQAWNLPLTRPYALGEADMYMLELRQRFPAVGALDARARAMAEEAQALVAELSSEERLVMERAAHAFAEYVRAFAEKRLEEQQIALFEQMREAIHARHTTGGAGLVEAAQIDVELAKAEGALARVAGEIARGRVKLNTLLGLPPDARLGEPIEAPPESVRLPLEALIARAVEHRGTLLSADSRSRAASARREAAEAEAAAPEFMLGLGYWQVPRLRPGVGVTASMSLPWLWGPSRDRVRQAAEEEAAERAARDELGLAAQAEVGDAHGRLRAIEAELVAIRGRALPAARRSMAALTSGVSTGEAGLLEWLEVARSVLDLERELVALNAELARSVASLERAVGVALPRTRLEEDTTR